MGTSLRRISQTTVAAVAAVAVAGIVAADAPVARVPPAPSAPQLQLLQGSDVVMHVLTALDRGERPGHVSVNDSGFPGTFSNTAAAWVKAAPAPARARREQVVAAALLFVAYRAIDGTSDGGSRFKILVEQRCARMRRGERTDFERRWLMASLAFAESSGDRRFLTGAGRACDAAPGPCDHLSHVRSRFPDESLVRLIELSPQPVAIASRQPGELAGQLARARVQPSPLLLLVLARAPSVARQESGLQPLLSDAIVGTDARLRLGLLRYSLNQRRESLDELARVIATSTHVEERVTAHYVSALIHESDLRPDEALRSFEEAIAAMPHMRSIALTLATQYYLAGRIDDASALLDRTFAADPPAFDPWRARYAVWTWYQAFDRLTELFR